MSTSIPISAPLPQYALIARKLTEDISNSHYKVGSLLPSEHELCKQFGVSRHTIREALRNLAERGMITRQRGIGTVVKSAMPDSRYIQATTASIDLPRYVGETKLIKTSVTEIIADYELSRLLDCPEGQRWLQVDAYRLSGFGQNPMALTRIFISAAYSTIHELIGTVKTPIYLLIEREFGIKITKIQQEINAVLINEDEGKKLDVKPNSAGLSIIRRYVDESDHIAEVALNLHPASRFSYSMLMRLPSSRINT